MDIDSRKAILNKQFVEARYAGICEDKKGFAQFIGRTYTNFTAAMKGNELYCTEKLIDVINEKLIKAGVISEPITIAMLAKNDDQKQDEDQKQDDDPKTPCPEQESSQENLLLNELKEANTFLSRIADALESIANNIEIR